LQPSQAGQLLFSRGQELFLQELHLNGLERSDLGGALAIPIHEGPFRDVEFSGDMSQAPALGTQFNEFIFVLFSMHGGEGLRVETSNLGKTELQGPLHFAIFHVMATAASTIAVNATLSIYMA
jgi:hypothetical protein